jgi:D-alanyl-D-alanine carboxypeptidase
VQDKRDPPASDVVVIRGISGSVNLHRRAAEAWTAMLRAARADGIADPLLLVVSGYRSGEQQERLWRSALVRYGSPEAARRWVGGQRLILCSDGASITPSARQGATGLTDIGQAIVATRHASAAATVRQIPDVIGGDSPDGPADDVAVITLRII